MWRAVVYCVQEALVALWRTKLVSLLSVGTIAVSFTVLGIFLLVGVNIGAVVENYGSSFLVHVFLRDEAGPQDLNALRSFFKEDGRVDTFSFVDKEAASERFNRLFPKDAELLNSLDSNPLPSSFEVQIREEIKTDSGKASELIGRIGSMAGVEAVRYDREWVETVQSVGNAVLAFGLFLGLLLMLAAIVTAANIIKINIYARREEIEIMRLVGADGIYVRGPFIVGGLMQGLLASLAAIAILLFLHQLVAGYLQVAKFELLGELRLRFLPLSMIIVLILGGLVIGLLASMLSFGRAGRT
jgi:cell division transport system permease protein